MVACSVTTTGMGAAPGDETCTFRVSCADPAIGRSNETERAATTMMLYRYIGAVLHGVIIGTGVFRRGGELPDRAPRVNCIEGENKIKGISRKHVPEKHNANGP